MADFVIIGKEDCPWCDKARLLVEEEGFTASYFDISVADSLRVFLKALDLQTVPQIFVQGGAYVGGYEDLKTAFEQTKEIVDGE